MSELTWFVRDLLDRFKTAPQPFKSYYALIAVLAVGLSVLASPVLYILAGLALVVGSLVLVGWRAIGRPTERWRPVVVAALILTVVFGVLTPVATTVVAPIATGALFALIGGAKYIGKRERAQEPAAHRELREGKKERRLREKEHRLAVRRAEKELHEATVERENRIKEAEEELAKVRGGGARRVASYRGKKGATLQLFEDRILTPQGEARFEDGPVEATVDTAGNLAVTRRGTLTRAVLLGGVGALIFKKAETHDSRELYILVDTPTFASLVQCNPNDGPRVRQLAVQINNASRAAMSPEEKARAVAEAEHTLELAKADRSAIEAAEKKLDAAKEKTGRLDTARSYEED